MGGHLRVPTRSPCWTYLSSHGPRDAGIRRPRRVRRDRPFNDPDTGEEVQIARIDTAHGYVHFDRLYRRDEPKDELDIGFWEAVERLEDDWRTFARGYDKQGDR